MTTNWRGHSLTWGKRLGIVILLLVGMCCVVLTLAERSKESLRKGLEDYFRQATGHQAEITDLVDASLIPDVMFNVRELNVRDEKTPEKIYMHADTAFLAVPFWRLMFSSGTYAAFEVKGLKLATGYFLPKKLDVDFGGISDPDPAQSPPMFLVEGRYNDQDLLVTLEMERKITKKGPLYSFGTQAPVTFKLGTLEGEGIHVRSFSSVYLDEAHLVQSGHEAKFRVDNLNEKPLNAKITGVIDDVPFKAILTKSGQAMLLKISPEVTSAEQLLKVKAFVGGIEKTIGVSDKDENMKIEIIQSSEPSSKESEQQ